MTQKNAEARDPKEETTEVWNSKNNRREKNYIFRQYRNVKQGLCQKFLSDILFEDNITLFNE